MREEIVLYSTCGNEDEALRIARALVDERLAACVNVLPAVRSIYRWLDKVEEAGEVLLIIKSTQARMERLRNRIAELHSYDVPEIIALPIVAGSEKYLAWLREQV